MSDEARGRILVVDDDPKSRELMAKILRSDGHTVTPVADGADAIALVGSAAESLDLVVSDVRMVEADGFQVLASFRKSAAEVPVILVTAFGNIDGAVDASAEAARLGQQDFRGALRHHSTPITCTSKVTGWPASGWLKSNSTASGWPSPSASAASCCTAPAYCPPPSGVGNWTTSPTS